MYGVTEPKLLDGKKLDESAVCDAIVDRLHIYATDYYFGSVEGAEEAVRDEIMGEIDRALLHFIAEREGDDLCPEGVEVINPGSYG